MYLHRARERRPAEDGYVHSVGVFVVGVWFHSAADTSLVQLLVAGGGDDFLVIEVVDHQGGLAVVGETLHERGVAVLAGVGAPHVGVDREVAHWQVRLGHHALGLYFFYRHIRLVSTMCLTE